MKASFKLTSVLTLGVLASILATPAWATLGTEEVQLNGTNSGGTVSGGTVCIDNNTCDTETAIGTIATTFGGVTVVGSTSTSGSPDAFLNLSITIDPTATGTITIALSDVGFTDPSVPLQLTQDVSGTSDNAAASLSAVGYFGATNVLFDTSGTATGTASTTIGAGEVFGSTGNITSGGPYSLTEFITIDVTALSTTNQHNFEVNADLSAASVPEPASVTLLGGILLFAGSAIRRKMRRA